MTTRMTEERLAEIRRRYPESRRSGLTIQGPIDIRDLVLEVDALRAELDQRGFADRVGRMAFQADESRLIARAEKAEGRADRLEKALILAEDALSRFPYTSGVWPNGMHPNEGIGRIRAVLGEGE